MEFFQERVPIGNLTMTELTTQTNERRKAGVAHQKKYNLKIDMTPMVDLGFLLISFFVITTEMSKPTTLNLNMPKEGSPMPLGESDALTVLLGKDNTIYYYQGSWEEAVQSNKIFETSFSEKDGLRKVIGEKQRQLDTRNIKEGRNGLMLLIKPGKEALYRNVIDMLDEALIHDIKKYAVLKPTEQEIKYLARNKDNR